MRKFVSVLLIVLIIASMMVACSQKPAAQAPTQNTTTPPASSSTADQDKSLQYIFDKKTLVLGLDDSFPPMGFRDSKDQIVGFDIDVAKEVAKRLGVELKLQPIDWNAKEQELTTKNIDCIWNGFSISPDRLKNLTMSNPYMDNNMALVVRADSGIKTLADMKGKKLGLQGGSSAADALDAAKDFKASLKNVSEFKDNMTALMDLDAKGVDAVLMDDVVSRYYIATNQKNFVIISEALSSEEYAVGFRKGDVKLADAVNEALSAMKKDGTLGKISTTWFGSDITKIK